MSDSKGVSSKSSSSSVFMAGIPDFILPTLPLPRHTWAGSFVNSYIYNGKTKNKIADTPTVDPVISQFGKECLENRFTVKFIEYVVANNYSKQLLFSNDQITFGFEFSRRLNKLGMLEIDPNADKIREVLSFNSHW